jgi:uncharacterized membrane protein YbhN (UPF0104 family)
VWAGLLNEGADQAEAASLRAPPVQLERGRRKPARRIAAAWIVAVLLLAWLTRGVDWSRLALAIGTVPWYGWGAVVLGLGASYVLRALRMHAELSRRRPVRVRECLELMLLHNAAVNVVPMRGGEAAYPLLVHRRIGLPVADAVASLVWMRTQDALVLSITGLVLWPGIAVSLRLIGAAALVAAAVVAVLCVQHVAARPQGDRRRSRAFELLYAGGRALAEAPRHGARGWVFCSLSWAVKLGSLGALLAALTGLRPGRALAGVFGGELAGVLPIQGPAGFGTYEAGVWAGSAMGVGAGFEIAAAALAVHAASLTTALVGGALALLLGNRRDLAGRAEAR